MYMEAGVTFIRRTFDLALIEQLPPLPAAALDLMRSFDSDEVNATEIAGKISRDPTLCLRVLKVVNSPFYGLPRQIGSLSEAVMVLGFGTVRSLVLGASLIARLPGAPLGGFEPGAVWKHSLYCALCAQRLAKHAGADPEWAFTAGLLHDIGKLVMYPSEPRLFERIRHYCGEKAIDPCQAERELLGVDHAQVGAKLLAHWQLPTAIEHAAACHHNPGALPGDTLNDLVHLADILAHAATSSTLERGIASVETTSPFTRLGLLSSQCHVDLEPLPDEFAAMRGLFGEE